MLGSDLLGFHLPQYCQNFVAAARGLFPRAGRRKRDAVVCEGRITKVRPFPISIDAEHFERLAVSQEVSDKVEAFRRRYSLPPLVGLGVDRLDYIKGIPDRLRAVGRFLELFPDYHGKFSFVQLAVPSRTELTPYRELRRTVEDLTRQINERFGERFGTDGWKPVVLIQDNLQPPEIAALYRLADFCLVSSLHDGMNLVAKEYVAAQRGGAGVLLLSRFTGTAEFLKDALLINPYDTEGLAGEIARALSMDSAEARLRMGRMRTQLRRRNIYRWTVDILAAAAECGAEPFPTSEERFSAAAS